MLSVITGGVSQAGGSLNIAGTLTLGAGSVLDIFVGGTGQTGPVAAGSAVILGGRLSLTLSGGFRPAKAT